MTDRTHVDSRPETDPDSRGARTIAGLPPPPPPPVRAGTAIARYVVLGELGRGGMGRVLRAYDPKLLREVALKELHDGSLDEESRRRLVVEARAMAKLSHPNVVGIYDVEDSEPDKVVLVMEYVGGTTLRQWLAAADRDLESIMARFVAAGRGLAAAHEVGLLHRDFKPANVLVGDDGVVKVTDFGLAKAALDASGSSVESLRELTDGDDLTRAGVVMGTPRYMAPEQHLGGSLTPAADQYSYCVALWEALCGAPPFPGEDLVEAKKAGPPPWPVPTTPSVVVDAIRRGLQRDPTARWISMRALLSALAPERRRARRTRWVVAGVAATLGVVGAFAWTQRATPETRCTGARAQLAGVWDDDVRARSEAAVLGIDKAFAPRVWDDTSRSLDAYADDWLAHHEDACAATTLRQEQSQEVMDLRMGCLRRAKSELAAVTEQLVDADVEVARGAHLLVGGLPALSRCDDVVALSSGVDPPPAAIADDVAKAREMLARIRALRNVTRVESVQRELQQALALVATLDYPPLHAEMTATEAMTLEFIGDYDASFEALERATRLAAANRDRDTLAAVTGFRLFLVAARLGDPHRALLFREIAEGFALGDPVAEGRLANYLGTAYATAGRYDDAVEQLHRAVETWSSALGVESVQVSVARTNLAQALEAAGRFAEAELEHRESLRVKQALLGPTHPDVSLALDGLGSNAISRGDHETGRQQLELALALRVEALGEQHPTVASTRSNLALALLRTGHTREAAAEQEKALAIREAALGADHVEVAVSHSSLAQIMWTFGREEEALMHTRRALAIYEGAGQGDHPNALSIRVNLASILASRGDPDAAEQELRAALAGLRAKLGRRHPTVATGRAILADVLFERGKLPEAEAERRASLEIMVEVHGEDHVIVAWSRLSLARILLEAERAAEALEHAERGWARLEREEQSGKDEGRARLVLARAQWAAATSRDERQRARRAAELALVAYERAAEPDREGVATVQAWLREHP